MSENPLKTYSREVKLSALARMEAGENVAALARELGVLRKHLYVWRDRFRLGGAEALCGPGRPRKGTVLASLAPAQSPASAPVVTDPVTEADPLAVARRRIAELERKVGRQELELDFFQAALRQVGELRQPSAAPGVTASTRSSKR
jgi:transposase